MTDLISRADAIEAVQKIVPYVIDKDTGQWGILVNKANIITELEALPSAEQVTSKLKNPCDSLLTDDSVECKEQKSKLDLISRADANNEICEVIMQEFDVPPTRAYEVSEKILKLLPSADRPSGEWRVVATTKPMYDRMGVLCWGSVYKCDQCDFTTWAVEGHFSQYNFCPNCGAKMKGGAE